MMVILPILTLVEVVAVDVIEDLIMNTDSLTFLASIAVFVAMFLTGLVVQVMVNGRLKKYHMEDPSAVGVILSISNNSPGRALSFLKFIIRREFSRLNDDTLDMYCNTLRIIYLCFVVLFLWLCYVVLFMLPRIQ